MNVAIVHYHLNRGGVSRVVENQLAALNAVSGGSRDVRVAILYGGRADGWPDDLGDKLHSIDLSLHAIPELDYDDRPVAQPVQLAAKLSAALAHVGFIPEQSLIHAHNHNLGKNASVPGALMQMAEDGFALLYQVHDFAEDFRPRNYRLLAESVGEDQILEVQFPQATHIHYAVLSRRDETVLKSTGVDTQRLHWLPNPVPALGPLPDRNAAREKLARTCGIRVDQRYLLYPVRGIRRKNLGELLLWAALVPEGTQLAVTLAPLNPAERPYYDAWENLAQELQLPCRFDTGGEGKLQFTENLAAADQILTTSVAEGFGMVFLEAWLAGRALAGRDLPEITADFQEEGLRLDRLYSRLDVPLDWVGEQDFRAALAKAYQEILRSYARPPLDPQSFDAAFREKLNGDCLDFGDLNEPLQTRVIRRVAADKSARRKILELNPILANSLDEDGEDAAELIQQNAAVVERQYSATASGKRLQDLYQRVLSSARGVVTGPPDRENRLLESFLDLRRFRLIRS